VLDVAGALMVDSYVLALIDGMSQLGLNERLLNRMRTVSIRKMIDAGRDSIPLMTWDDGLSVGVKTLDDQHKRLIELLNQLHRSKASGKGDSTTRSVLNELLAYTVDHFACEERLFEQHGYPVAADHRQQHEILKGQVVDFATAFEAGKASLSAELFLFLRGWLNGHIRASDRGYGPFLSERGVG
jgi:hemerythrin-like metal-binding protein